VHGFFVTICATTNLHPQQMNINANMARKTAKPAFGKCEKFEL
jgi:hypothetical protein